MIGTVKIGSANQQRGASSLGQIAFERLNEFNEPPQWFSLGDLDYYQNLRALGAAAREGILTALGDISFSPAVFEVALQHEVTTVSLLRGVEADTVSGQYNRVASGGVLRTEYSFSFAAPGADLIDGPKPPPLAFDVTPNSTPPTNVHVLIGRNGVGKTTTLWNIANASLFPDRPEDFGRVKHLPTASGSAGTKFVNVVSVSFSAFDPFTPVSHHASATTYEYIGLGVRGSMPGERKSAQTLNEEFLASLAEIRAAGRHEEWHAYMDTLGSDPQFAQSPIHEAVRSFFECETDECRESWGDEVFHGFKALSSGHAIVLLTMTRLIELVAEQSLVLLDEPESHLHPPLLAGFVRVLSDLLTDRNAVAIVATHSPVVLQEVPASCVYKLNLSGDTCWPRRPRIETYGENVGVLTHEIFGLEVMDSGFYAEIRRAVRQLDTYEEVLDRFGNKLGSEAKGLVRVLLAEKNDPDGHL
ncbi:AAA family ATPase [Streptomyces sp. NBC_01006]|uniref:AAA family ATPase n=1 Tax=Streptomyces sp. NBC_01006 TaxID=2903716 RepID=UPI00386D24D3|nr:ATP-binding protein [Streptomyces sp. NBC_01006]